MNPKKILPDDRGNITVEYIIFIAAAGTLLIAGVAFLYNALGAFFQSWAGYFGG